MGAQWTILFSFIGGVVSVWLCMNTSKKVYKERMDTIKRQIISKGGVLISVEKFGRKNTPFTMEFSDSEFEYIFFKITYLLGSDIKEGWAILGIKQNWFGPGGAIDSKWAWQF